MHDQRNAPQQAIGIGRQAFVLPQYAAPHMDSLLRSVPALQLAGGREQLSILGVAAHFVMPEAVARLARDAAAAAGFEGFEPGACRLRHYLPTIWPAPSQGGQHHDPDAPVVSVSLGMAATYLLQPREDSGPAVEVPLRHGDVAVWRGGDRLRYHGAAAPGDNAHPELGCLRLEISFRRGHAART